MVRRAFAKVTFSHMDGGKSPPLVLEVPRGMSEASSEVTCQPVTTATEDCSIQCLEYADAHQNRKFFASALTFSFFRQLENLDLCAKYSTLCVLVAWLFRSGFDSGLLSLPILFCYECHDSLANA